MKTYETEIDSDIGRLTVEIQYEVIGESGDGYNTPHEAAHVNVLGVGEIKIIGDAYLEEFIDEIEESERYDPEDYRD